MRVFSSKIILSLAVVILAALLIFIYKPNLLSNAPPAADNDSNTDENGSETVEVVAQDLLIPWDIAFLPDGTMLVTQRDGKLLKVDTETHVIQQIDDVVHNSEGGLLGLAIHPDFDRNHYIYIYLTARSGDDIINRVERYIFENDSISERRIIVDSIEASSVHDGGRIRFGPDGYLYITTGDAGQEDNSQDKLSLNGKILRVTDEGDIPQDNPYKSPVYSYGHRNPQGLAWDSQNRLWSTEHGPSGSESGFDEVNLIQSGDNYGWPIIRGSERQNDMIIPIMHSGANDTWAPAGAAILNDTLYFTGLRGEALYSTSIHTNGTLGELVTHFKGEYGRLRAVTVGPDGHLYISTSNLDGRGTPPAGGDKILRIRFE
jgi:glucose/arabinose dehydrogenase